MRVRQAAVSLAAVSLLAGCTSLPGVSKKADLHTIKVGKIGPFGNETQVPYTDLDSKKTSVITVSNVPLLEGQMYKVCIVETKQADGHYTTGVTKAAPAGAALTCEQ